MVWKFSWQINVDNWKKTTHNNYQHRPSTFNMQPSIYICGSTNLVKCYGSVPSLGGVEYSWLKSVDEWKEERPTIDYQHPPTTFNMQKSICISGSNNFFKCYCCVPPFGDVEFSTLINVDNWKEQRPTIITTARKHSICKSLFILVDQTILSNVTVVLLLFEVLNILGLYMLMNRKNNALQLW